MTNNGISFKSISRMLPNKGCVLTLGVAARVLRLLMPLVFGALVNGIAAFENESDDIRVTLALVVALLSGEILSVLIGIGGEKLSISSFAEFSCLLKERVWAAVCKLPQLEYDRVSVGEWERKISYDVEMVADAVRIFMGSTMNFAVTFLGTFLIIIFKQPLLGITFLMALALSILTHLLVRKRLARVSNLMRKQFYREGTAIYGCIEMQPLLRAFSLLDVFSKFFSHCVNRTRIAVTRNWRVMADFRLWLQVEFWAVKAIVLCSCVVAFCRGLLSMGAVISFTMLVNQLIDCVSDFMTMLPQLNMGYESSKALRAVLDKSESEGGGVSISQESLRHNDADAIIVLDDVSFHYPCKAENIIEGFSACIRRNEFVCFLGCNGAGKSTLAKILLGQYEPTKGRVWRNLSKQAWVSQRITTFEGSVLENVRLMDKTISRQDALKAIELCGLKKFVDGLEGGIDAHIKTDAMSGGELQALGIARAVVRMPDLIVADEITNNLDIVAKQRVYKALQSLRENRAIILVSHDLDSIRLANRIFLFGNGTPIRELPAGITQSEVLELLAKE